MYAEGERIEVQDPDGSGWIAATFREVAEGKSRHIDDPGVNNGAGYDADQAWVTYEEGKCEGMTGLHTFFEMRRPESDPEGGG